MRMQKANRNRLYTCLADARDNLADFAAARPDADCSICERSFPDREPTVTLGERRRVANTEVVNVVPYLAPDFEHVSESLGRNQCSRCALAFN